MTPQECDRFLQSGDKFRHYKGGIYTYLHVGRSSETEEWFVVYQSVSGDVWIRAYEMFFEAVEVNGQSVPRFQRIDLLSL